MDERIEEQAIDVSKVMQALEVRALAQMHHLLSQGGTEKIRLEAAKDLLDRGNRTSKIQKSINLSPALDKEGVERLAVELAASRRVRERFHGEVQGNWERVGEEVAAPKQLESGDV